VLDPARAEALPASQLTQSVSPTPSLYLPAVQLEQVAAAVAEKVPATQVTQVSLVTAAVAEDAEPASQLLHSSDPARFANLPTAQAAHVEELVWAAAAEYRPSVQLVQLPCPVEAW